jgi:hypothetical protein
VAATADQRAVIIDHGDAETIVLQTGYDGDASDFAWVIPIPTMIAGAAAVDTTDPEVFSALNSLTAPQYFTGGGGTSGICGCSGSEGGGDAASNRGQVTVWDAFSVDGYDAVVLSAEQSGALDAWLNANGYAFPADNQDVLAHYLAKGWFFIAFKVSPDAPAGDGATAGDGKQFRPIAVTFATDEIVFPMHISQVSTTERVEVLLYVLSDHRVRSTTYATREIQAGCSWDGQNFESVYDGWFEQTIADAGGRALVVEYAGELPTWWASDPPFSTLLDGGREYYVTRLRTRLTPEQMNEDIVMTTAASDADMEVIVASRAGAARGPLAFAVLLLAGVQGVAFRRWEMGRRIAVATAWLGLFMILL